MRSAGGDEDDPQLGTQAQLQQKRSLSEEATLSFLHLKP
jgi:hypothetical protein